MFEGLFGGKKGDIRGDEAIVYTITESKLRALTQHFDTEMSELSRRIAKLEGAYGKQIAQLNQTVNELTNERDQLEQEAQAVNDEVAKRSQLMQAAPAALAKSGLAPEKQQQILALLADPKNQQQIDALIEQYFPDVPITTEGLIGLMPMLPLLTSFIGKGGEQPPTQDNGGWK